jgi:cytochrome c6
MALIAGKLEQSRIDPDGGDTINPQKTLHAKALAANNITKPEDIVKTMRNPGPGMNKFDQTTIPDEVQRQ